MASRENFGSWLQGGPTPDGGATSRLGLPPSGPGSLAPVTRRVVALIVDWAVASLISYLLFQGNAWATLGVFAVENLLLVSLIGTTIGHRLLGIQVRVLTVPDDAAAPAAPAPAGLSFVGFFRGAIRTLLLCLVIPAVIWDADGRGLHDKAAGTVIVRR
jgi:uncharacterized RDD family membrane protein YckC